MNITSLTRGLNLGPIPTLCLCCFGSFPDHSGTSLGPGFFRVKWYGKEQAHGVSSPSEILQDYEGGYTTYEEYIRMTAHQCQYVFRPLMESVMSKRQEAVPPGKVFNLKA